MSCRGCVTRLNEARPGRTRSVLASVFVVWSMLEGGSPVLARPFAYVPGLNLGPDVVTVIDTATNLIVATIPVGDFPGGIAVSPDGSRVVVGHGISGGFVSIIDASRNVVLATLPTGNSAGIAISPEGIAFVAANGLTVIDTFALNLVKTINIQAEGVVLSPDGSRLYVTSSGNPPVGALTAYDSTTFTKIGSVGVGDSPRSFAVTPSGRFLYVPNHASDTVSVVDTAALSIVTTVPVGDGPLAIAITPDGEQAFVTNNNSHTISVIDTGTNSVIDTVPTPPFGGPSAIAITPDGRRAYYLQTSRNRVEIMDTVTHALIGEVAVSAPTAFGDFIGPDGPIAMEIPTLHKTGYCVLGLLLVATGLHVLARRGAAS